MNLKMGRISILAIPFVVAAIAIAANRAGQAQDWRQRLGDWQYPAATVNNGGSAGGGATGAVNTFLSHASASMTTRDSLDDVVKYYEKKTGCSLTPAPFSGYGRSVDGMTNIFEDDSKSRPLTLRIFQQHTKVYSLTLVISRGEGEKLTHVYWTFVNH